MRRDKGEALLVLGGLMLLAAAGAAAQTRKVERKVEKTIVEEREDVDLATEALDHVVENYAPDDIRRIWESLTPEQKSMIAATIVAKAKEGISAIQDALTGLASRIGGAVAAAINWLKEKLWAILAALGIGVAAAVAGGWAGPVASAVGAMFYPL